MFDKFKSYAYTFFAGIGAAILAWIAFANRKTQKPPEPQKLELELQQAKDASDSIQPQKPPDTLQEKEEFLRKNGYLK